MVQTKATKKFEQRHLKDVLERRKGLKKIKQRQQIKAKRKVRRSQENGPHMSDEAQANVDDVSAKSQENALQDMSVDEFFQHGSEIPALLPQKGSKRKRQEDEEAEAHMSDASFEQEAVPVKDGSAADSDEDELDHQQQLDALAENDPEFYKHLQENEPELLDAELDRDIVLSEDDEEESKRKKQKKAGASAENKDSDVATAQKNGLDKSTVTKWQKALTEQHSLRALREVVLAFRSAAQVSEDEDKNFKYSISDPDVYHLLLITALRRLPTVFNYHLPVQESKSGRVHVPTESKKFKTLAPLLKSQTTSIMQLLDHLSDASTLRLTLSSTIPLLPYMLSFKKLVRDLARASASVWSSSSSTEATRVAAFLVLRRLIVIGDPGIRENVLRATYKALVQGSRNVTMHTMPGVNLMKNSGAELWGLAADSGGGGSVAYTTPFTFIRQLAIHLRSSITNNSNESYKTVYNWQYVHSLDFWSRVLSSHATVPASPLRPLIYPLVQVTLGALRLIPTATYFPLRFQLIRSLLRISLATATYIPLASALYEVLNSAEMRKAPKASTLKPLDFATSIRAAKSYLRTRVYQDGVGEQVAELMSEFLVLWAKNIAFPELSLPVTVMLRRWLKEVNSREREKGNRNQKVNGMISLVVQKVEANSKFIEEKRAKVDFAPNDRKGVESFLEEVGWEKTPLGAFVVGQRKTREEKARLIEEGRKEEERRREKDKRDANGTSEEFGQFDSGSEDEDAEGVEGGEMMEEEDDDDEDDESEDDDAIID